MFIDVHSFFFGGFSLSFITFCEITLIDIGHYESEQFTKDLIFEFLNKNLINIALHLSNENTNPIKYY